MAPSPSLSVVHSTLIAFCVFAAITLLVLIIAIWARKSWLGRIRMFTIIPLALAGAMATCLFNQIRGFGFLDKYHSQVATLFAVYGIASVTLVFAAAWDLIAWIILWILKKESSSASSDVRTLDRKRSSAYFYLITVDLAVLGCLLASVVIGGAFNPWRETLCSDPAYRNSLMIALIQKASDDDSNTEACQRSFYILVMSGVSAALMAGQIVLEFPLVNTPNGLRFAIFFVIRLVRRPGSKHRDLERAEVEEPLMGTDKANLDEEVARLVEKHPHYADLLSAVQESKGIASPEHLELIAEKGCGGNTKSQCWACEGVICDDCTTPKSDIPVPRTTNHIVHCFAMCTSCYLIRGSSQPAAFSATLNPTDLSRQHHACSFEEKRRATAGDVSICKTCAKGTPAEISIRREEREENILARTLRRGILCAECEKPIPKRKRRWWICGQGDHDCHWGGHEVSR